MRVPDLTPLMERLGYRFGDVDILVTALTHPSASSPARPDNQRLEFLGDRVLGLVIAEAMYREYPGASEGDLAPRLNALVRREALAEVAAEIGLGAFLMLGRSESTSGGRRKAAILADALEAVIAAVYRDGGLDAAAAFILKWWQPRIVEQGDAPLDAKTQLQEWAQARGLAPPEYRMTGRTGPDHAPHFAILATLETGARGEGAAGSKKQAEQRAAAELLAQVTRDE